MNTREMEAKIKDLENKVKILEDIEAIKRLQKSYGYYLEHWMYKEIIDCFSDSPDTELNIMVGIFLGKEGVRRYFIGEKERSINPEMLHQIMQLSGIVDIEPDGKTAQGRWYGFGAMALPTDKGVLQNLTGGVYTSKYIKEDGKWTILKLVWNPAYAFPPAEGWVKPERVGKITVEELPKAPPADKPRKLDTRYPSGYIVPFHYHHPVTNKKTSEGRHNALLNQRGMIK
jgi:hypothetical protein